MTDWNNLVRRMRQTNSLLADEIDSAYRERNGVIASEQYKKSLLHRTLENIAKQQLKSEMQPDYIDGADYEGAYHTIVQMARDAIAPQP